MLLSLAAAFGEIKGSMSLAALRAALGGVHDPEDLLKLRRVMASLGWRRSGGKYWRNSHLPALILSPSPINFITVTPAMTNVPSHTLLSLFFKLEKALGDMTGTIVNVDAWRIISKKRLDQDTATTLGAAMRQLGWYRSKRNIDGRVYFVYARGRRHIERHRLIYVFRDPITDKVIVTYDQIPKHE